MISKQDLNVDSVTVDIGSHRILDEVRIVIPVGSLTLIQGRSGAGKSTLLHAILGLVGITAGQICLGDVDLVEAVKSVQTELRRHTGIIYQDPLLLSDLTVQENVSWMARLRGHKQQSALALTEDALAAVDMSTHSLRRVHNLSGGEAQRVSIARAIVGNPLMLLADEPTSALDTLNSHMVGRLLRSLAFDKQIPILVASHDPILSEYADKIVRLEDGRVTDV